MASITYRIGGTYNGQAISQAQNGLSSLSDIAGKLKGAFVAVTALKKLSIFQMNVRKPMAYKKKRLTGYLKQYGIIINLPKQVLNPLLIIPENYKGNRYMETKHYKGKPPISPRWVMKKKKSKKY